MIRTRRSIEEEQRVRILPHKNAPFYFEKDEFFTIFEQSAIEELIKWVAEENKRILIVGLDDNGKVSLSLLSKGMFVVVVDERKEKIASLRESAKEKKLDLKLNTYEKDYMKIDFLPSGFDTIVFYGILNRYNEPEIVLKKAKREVKVGGKIFFRIQGLPFSAFFGVFEVFRKIKNNEKYKKILASINKNVFIRSFLRPFENQINLGAFLIEIEKELKIERIIYDHLLGEYFYKFSYRFSKIFLEDKIKKILFSIRKFEKKVFSKPYLGYFATTIYAFAVKELELGRRFKIENL